ncbi:unnamed protein product [Calypogeia fissa]
MKVLPSALRTMLVHHHHHPPPPSLTCSSCSKIVSYMGNGNLGTCSLSSGFKCKQQGLEGAKSLGFCSSLTSTRLDGGAKGAGGGGHRAGSSPNRFICMQQGGGHGGQDLGFSLGWQQQQPGREGNPSGARRLWISPPLQMGRRSAKIATKKGAQDKKKAKLYGRIGKQIVAAVKRGGPSPVSNLALAALQRHCGQEYKEG